MKKCSLIVAGLCLALVAPPLHAQESAVDVAAEYVAGLRDAATPDEWFQAARAAVREAPDDARATILANVLYGRAAEAGHPEASYVYGLAIVNGKVSSRPAEDGVALIQAAAEAGLAVAQNRLGKLLCEGYVPGSGREQGLEWFGRAAQQGHVSAMRNFGVTLLSVGDPKRRDEAVAWLLVAADRGSKSAARDLVAVLEKLSRRDRERVTARSVEIARTIRDGGGDEVLAGTAP